MTGPTDTTHDPDVRQCGCCGRPRPARRVAELGATPGVFICAGCALWAARRAGLFSALRHVRLRALLPHRRSHHAPHAAHATIPILPSTDLDRTTGFYAAAGFAEATRHDQYLVLHNDGVELHFSLHDTATPGTCFIHVTDAAKLWQHLHNLGTAGLGNLADQDYGLREFTVTDPDGNHIRIGSPRR